VELMDANGKNVTRIADERDTADITSQYAYHYAALKNLRENTENTRFRWPEKKVHMQRRRKPIPVQDSEKRKP
jgi:hypothetical protein